MDMGRKNTAIAAAFPVEETDDLMMISDAGKTIRVPVASVSVQRRGSGGVTVFRVEGGERVVAVERIEETSGEAGA
jgi:DNA gyrase subunit A